MTKHCPDGHENPDSATFCDQCGKPLEETAAASLNDLPTLPTSVSAVPEADLAVTQVAPPAPPAPMTEVPEEAPTLPAPPPMPEPPAMPPSPDLEPTVVASPPAPAHPRLTVHSGGHVFDLAGKTSAVLGREDAPSNSFPDVDLSPFGAEEGGVSRLHARLMQSGDEWMIEDLESTNFTFVNGKRIPPKTPTPISDGTELRLGRVALKFTTMG